MPKTFTVYRPGSDFPSFSVTAGRCALQCEHCGGRYLKGMAPADSPERLLSEARAARSRGATGVLVSGGCDADGTVPLSPFLGAISQLRREGMLVNVHTGLLDGKGAKGLAATRADAFSVDLLQDAETITRQLHLDAAPADYERTIRLLAAEGAAVVPHVCVGLQSTDGEDRCLELLGRVDIAAIVVLALMPPPGAATIAGLDDSLVRFVGRASSLPVPVLVGCMRPRGRWETEVRCIQAGAGGMACPSPRTVEWLNENGYEVIEERSCCALHRKMAPRT